MIGELFSIMVPILISVGLGFVWGRRGGRFDSEMVTQLVTGIGAPALIFHIIANLQVGLAEFGSMVGATLATLLATGVVGCAVLFLFRLPWRAFLPVLMFPNTGNVGLPLSLLAFGNEGLTLAIGVFAVYVVVQFTIGVALASGHFSLRYLARMPLVWSLALGLAFLLAGVTPPAWLNATTELLGGMSIPLMLITLGVSLSALRIAGLERSLLLAGLRLGLGFAVSLTVAYLLHLEGTARGVLILQHSMPTAVFNYLFAQRYNTRPAEVAGAVTVSTLLTFVILPLILVYLL